MKAIKLLVLMLCMTFFLPLQAQAKWVYSQSDDSFYEKIDDERIGFNDPYLTFWQNIYMKKEGKHYISKINGDIRKMKYRLEFLRIENDDGTIKTYDEIGNWNNVPPGSYMEHAMNKAADLYLKKNK